eukprot:11890374-Ditylum_brightwellii.AAC.1
MVQPREHIPKYDTSACFTALSAGKKKGKLNISAYAAVMVVMQLVLLVPTYKSRSISYILLISVVDHPKSIQKNFVNLFMINWKQCNQQQEKMNFG